VIGTVGPFASGEDYDNGWVFARELKLKMVDEHYYVPPQWFWDNLTRYDSYPRGVTNVYVGEYAAHDQGRRNTLRSAMAEAAGLTSFERNGDIVQFASYAPLFARRNHTQWHPDMIYFTGTEVFLTANYYVQQLFGQNSGDRYLESELNAPEVTRLAVSTVLDSETGDIIVKVVNGDDEPGQINVKLAGLASDVTMKATKTILTGPDADAVNEDGKAPVIKPQVSTESVKPVFSYTAPANSLTIYRIDR
jgi:alpha-L-arabinofuranosidase